VQLGREDAGKGILLQWDPKNRRLVQSSIPPGIFADGDVRDVITVQTANKQRLIILSKNNDHVQVIRAGGIQKNESAKQLALFKPKRK
jgi:hypothetical protein